MEPEKHNESKSLQYYMRSIHRVLGYLAVGMVIVYALSGIVLIHRTGDFCKTTVAVEATLAPGLGADELKGKVELRNFQVTDDTPEAITFNTDGRYDKTTGVVTYSKQQYISPIDKFVALHVLPDAKNRHIAIITTTFGIVLLLLGLTSLFMYKPKGRRFKANMIYTAIGVVITVVLILML